MGQNQDRELMIMGMIISVQAEMQATRDTLLGLVCMQMKLPDAAVNKIHSSYQHLLEEAKKTILAKIKADHIEGNESIEAVLRSALLGDQSDS